jgi:hypothetical protein
MLSATRYAIRYAGPADVPELVRLGWSTSETWPSGHVIVGEIGGVVAAAFAIDENRSVMADLPGAGSLLAHIRAQAAGIRAYHRTPSVADRIRERLARRVAFGT